MKTLILTISNLEQLQHGVTTHHPFNRRGGTIGSQDADWRLADRDRRIAPVHCEIRWSENSFCVLDRCGRTYLNDSLLSLGHLAPVRLQAGDCLQVGAYRLLVHYHQGQERRHIQRCALEQLFDPGKHVLDALVADMPPRPLHHAIAPAHGPATDIYETFSPQEAVDPLALLDARPRSPFASTPGHRTQRIIRGASS